MTRRFWGTFHYRPYRHCILLILQILYDPGVRVMQNIHDTDTFLNSDVRLFNRLLEFRMP